MWEELKAYIEDEREGYLIESEMYYQNEGDLWANSDELGWGCRCKANTCDMILRKMERLEKKTMK